MPSLKIAVCVKHVPDTEARLRVARGGAWIEEDDLPFVLSEGDEYALEEGLRWAEKLGGEVVAVSLGPERAREGLRKALALGAARGVLLKDEAFRGGDAWSTATALHGALRREDFDLVLAGSQSDDLGYGCTGSILAGLLGWPHAWLVMGLEIEPGGTARVVREMESGKNEILRLRLPAVLQVQAGINHPRYASLKGIMAAKKKEIAEPTAAELGLDAAAVGAAGSRLEVVAVGNPDTGAGAQRIEGDAATAARTLVEKLRREARVL
jgi:electron transfer flavoprotein beta subunit